MRPQSAFVTIIATTSTKTGVKFVCLTDWGHGKNPISQVKQFDR